MKQINSGNNNPVLFSDEIKWLRDDKKTSEAIDLYLRAVERNAVSSHVLANYTKTLQIAGRGDEASRIRMEQIDQGIKEPAFYNDEAFWQLEQNRIAQAYVRQASSNSRMVCLLTTPTSCSASIVSWIAARASLRYFLGIFYYLLKLAV